MSGVVCNAGPLIALSKIGQLSLLHSLFGKVLMSREVCAEVERGGHAATGTAAFSPEPWLQVTPLAKPVDALLTSVLDLGEASTISLAIQQSASLVLIDEVKGRRVARDLYGLAVIGTGRVLVEAKRAGLIPQVRPLIEQMRSVGYWIADAIVAEILHQAGE